MSLSTLKVSTEKYLGELHLLLGAMTSAKTTTLISMLTIKAKLKYKVAYINTNKDKRETAGGDGKNFSSHNPMLEKIPDGIDCYSVEKLADVDVSKYDVIGVDEGHFFTDLYDTVMYWVEGLDQSKYVIVSGLDSSYQRVSIGQLLELLTVADTYQKLSGQCMRCIRRLREAGITTPVNCPAIFTARLTDETDVFVAGGEESYEAVCRKCHKDIEEEKKARRVTSLQVSSQIDVDVHEDVYFESRTLFPLPTCS